MKKVILLSGGFRAGTRSEERTIGRLYGDALAQVGAMPVLYLGGEPLADRWDGLLLSGGGDIDPAWSRQPQDARLRPIDVRRDREELALIGAFVQARKPILGICRGLQLLNVAFGGTLYPHVEGHEDHAHRVDLTAGSRLAALCGERVLVNSYHHQAIQDLGTELQVTARARDGVIEGIEHPDLPILGVQWHPERMIRGLCTDTADEMGNLFAWLAKDSNL